MKRSWQVRFANRPQRYRGRGKLDHRCGSFANASYEKNARSYELRIGGTEELDEAGRIVRIVDHTGNRIVLKSLAAG